MIQDAESLVGAEEGRRYVAYWDNANPRNATNGIGHKDNSMVVGVTTWDDATIDATFATDMAIHAAGIRARWPAFDSLDVVRQAYVISMAFQMGVSGAMGFTHTLGCLACGDWQGAHDGIMASAFGRQTPERAGRCAMAFLTGQYQQIP